MQHPAGVSLIPAVGLVAMSLKPWLGFWQVCAVWLHPPLSLLASTVGCLVVVSSAGVRLLAAPDKV